MCHSLLVGLKGRAKRLAGDTDPDSCGKVIREQNLLSAFVVLP